MFSIEDSPEFIVYEAIDKAEAQKLSLLFRQSKVDAHALSSHD